jgi:hypothetical protein
MSVSSAAARVGAEIMKMRVEIPAVVTPIIELITTSRRIAPLTSGECVTVTRADLLNGKGRSGAASCVARFYCAGLKVSLNSATYLSNSSITCGSNGNSL